MKHNNDKNRTTPKTINTKMAVADILNRFSYITRTVRDNRKGTKLYSWQQDIMYIVNDITNGPTYIAPKVISKAYYVMGLIDTEIRSKGFNNKVTK